MASWLGARGPLIHLAIFVAIVLAILAIFYVAQPPRTVANIMITVGTLVAAAGLVWKRWRPR